MSARLSSKRAWTTNVRLKEESPTLDLKNPLHAAVMGKTIRDIKDGNFEDMANLQHAADIYNLNTHGDTPQKIGEVEVTIMTDKKGNTHAVEDTKRIELYLANGFEITGTEIREVTG